MLNVYTVAYNRPDHIRPWVQSMVKHIGFATPLRFTVFDNSIFDRRQHTDAIKAACADQGVHYIPVQRDIFLERECEKKELRPDSKTFNPNGTYMNANVGAAYGFEWAWKNYIVQHGGKFLLTHSDVFFVRRANLLNVLQDHDLTFPLQAKEAGGRKVEYMWEAFVLGDLDSLPQPETISWWCGGVDGVSVDVGGQSARYLREHHELRFNRMGQAHHEERNVDYFSLNALQPGYEVLHYRSGSNWNHKSEEYHREKTNWLRQQL